MVGLLWNNCIFSDDQEQISNKIIIPIDIFYVWQTPIPPPLSGHHCTFFQSHLTIIASLCSPIHITFSHHHSTPPPSIPHPPLHLLLIPLLLTVLMMRWAGPPALTFLHTISSHIPFIYLKSHLSNTSSHLYYRGAMKNRYF